MSAHTPKKRKVDGTSVVQSGEDSVVTPRARLHNLRLDAGEASHASETTSSSADLSRESGSQHTSRSKSISPSKQLRHLSLNNNSIKILPLAAHDERFPTQARPFAARMASIAAGREVLDEAYKGPVAAHLTPADSDDFQDWVYHSSQAVTAGASSRQSQEEAPYVLRRMRRIVRQAQECELKLHEEAGWNVSVHGPLLDLAVELASDERLSWLACTTANINHHHKYYPGASRVDFALTLNPLPQPSGQNSKAEAAQTEQHLRSIQRKLPDASVNHTSFEPLCYHPISLSIETKRLDAVQDRKADLQLGLWLAAQGQCLALSSRLQHEEGHDARDNFFEPAGADGSATNTGIWHPPTFLPGVIVQGHVWKLVLATFDGASRDTTLWKMSRPFGSTDSMLGAMQVLAGLKELNRWSLNELCPWYREKILRIEP